MAYTFKVGAGVHYRCVSPLNGKVEAFSKDVWTVSDVQTGKGLQIVSPAGGVWIAEAEVEQSLLPVNKLGKTLLKFLSCADQSYNGKSQGTHYHNLKSWYGKLLDGGYVQHETAHSVFVHVTPTGQTELRTYYALGGKRH